MTDQWCVLLNTGTDLVVYGPMDAREAEEFAAFMTRAVDPARPRPLRSPVREMLGWWRSEDVRNNCTHGADCEVHPDARGVHNFDPCRGACGDRECGKSIGHLRFVHNFDSQESRP